MFILFNVVLVFLLHFSDFQEKLEYWWLYIADKKARSLVTPPMQIRSLQSDEEVSHNFLFNFIGCLHFEPLVFFFQVQLKFTAPMEPGPYVFTVCLRSDSYLHLDVFKNIKVSVLLVLEIRLLCTWSNIF